MAENIFKLKQQLCDIGRNIWLKGFCAGNEGNHSVRIDEKRVLCTPTGISKGSLTPDMICTVDMEGNQIDKHNGYKRTSEILVHLAIYKKRPDIKAVIHSHPPHATAFAIAQIPIPEGIHPEAEVFLGRVPTAPYATPSKQDLPDSILPLIGPETNTVMMGNHGSVSFSRKGLTDAYYLLEILDAYCRILILTKHLGHANVLRPDQMAELLEVKAKFGLKDDRLACAATGCVGAEQNQEFFASFEDRPCCASCESDGGEVSTAAGIAGDPFEQMVQAITDQIMAAAR
jgi:L-fuculose-phosphate aldolase